MAVAFVGNGTLATNTTTASMNITDAAVSSGTYLLIATLIAKSNVDLQPPDGTWTELIDGWTDCTAAADDHKFAVFYKTVSSYTGGVAYTFFKDIDDNVLWAGVISTWSGHDPVSPLDDTAVGSTGTTAAAENVSFPAFDPTGVDSEIVFVAFYGNDLTTFAAAMSSDVNPDCTKRFDLETASGNDATIALTSGPTTDGSNIASRTWASGSTTDAGNTGVVFGIKTPAAARLLALLGVGL